MLCRDIFFSGLGAAHRGKSCLFAEVLCFTVMLSDSCQFCACGFARALRRMR